VRTTIALRRLPALMTLAMAGLLTFDVSVVLAQRKKSTASRDDRSPYAELTKVPEKARARRNPLESDLDATAAGGKLFEQHCSECHGKRAEGGRMGPSLRHEKVQQATPGALFWVLTNGVVRRGMPVWSKLPEQQRWQIVTFLKSRGLEQAGRRPRPRPSR
jgi:mono/diheme cytochrome c family protein